jgi:dUTP pyrophosphatase
MSGILPIEVQVRRLSERAAVPHLATDGAACFDLAACTDRRHYIAPMGRLVVPTGLAFAIPAHYEGQIRPRSGLGRDAGLHVALGTIDADYRGEVSALCFNLGYGVIAIEPGERIAQLAIRPVPPVRFVEVDELEPTVRGVCGWGSTGS